jgi:hypothetical protein
MLYIPTAGPSGASGAGRCRDPKLSCGSKREIRRGRGTSHQQDIRSDNQNAAVPASLCQSGDRLAKRGDEWCGCAPKSPCSSPTSSPRPTTQGGRLHPVSSPAAAFGNLEESTADNSVSGRLKVAHRHGAAATPGPAADRA